MDTQNHRSRTTNALDFTFSPNIKATTSPSLPASAARTARTTEGRNKENEEVNTSIDAMTKQPSKVSEVCAAEQEEFLSLR